MTKTVAAVSLLRFSVVRLLLVLNADTALIHRGIDVSREDKHRHDGNH